MSFGRKYVKNPESFFVQLSGFITLAPFSLLETVSQSDEEAGRGGLDVVVRVEVDQAEAVAAEEAEVAVLELETEGGGEVEAVVVAVVAIHGVVILRGAGVAKDGGSGGDVGIASKGIAECGACKSSQFGAAAEVKAVVDKHGHVKQELCRGALTVAADNDEVSVPCRGLGVETALQTKRHTEVVSDTIVIGHTGEESIHLRGGGGCGVAIGVGRGEGYRGIAHIDAQLGVCFACDEHESCAGDDCDGFLHCC